MRSAAEERAVDDEEELLRLQVSTMSSSYVKDSGSLMIHDDKGGPHPTPN